MSVVRIKEHGESVYNLIRVPPQPQTKAEWYTSKFRQQVRDDTKSTKQDHRTFGVACVPVNKPSDFLKKNTGIVPPRPSVDPHCCLNSHRLPPIPPTVKKGALVPLDETKNFRRLNIDYASRLVPRQPKKNIADTRTGDIQRIDNAGLVPKFARNKTYGKIPDYIEVRREKEREGVCIEKAKKEREGNQLRYVSSCDRDEMLTGMKKNWELKQRDYQLLPMMTDTISKVNHKLKLEAELKQIEHDIETINRHKLIYVIDKPDVENPATQRC